MRQNMSKYVFWRFRISTDVKYVKMRLFGWLFKNGLYIEVVRDLRKQLAKPGTKMDDTELARCRKELQAFCSAHVPKPEELPRVTTCVTIACTDHALQTGAKLNRWKGIRYWLCILGQE